MPLQKRRQKKAAFILTQLLLFLVLVSTAGANGTSPSVPRFHQQVKSPSSSHYHGKRGRVVVFVREEKFSEQKKGRASDAALAEAVKDALLEKTSIDVRLLHITGAWGRIYLSGVVNSSNEMGQAEEVARKVEGVVSVKNDLSFRRVGNYLPPGFRNDKELKKAIVSHLFWSPDLVTRRMSIRVDRGVATLKGVVENQVQYHLAEHKAYEGGALDVKNDLCVRASPQFHPCADP